MTDPTCSLDGQLYDCGVTTTTAPTMITIAGSVRLEVTNATALLQDAAFSQLMLQFIASAGGVPVSTVTVTLSAVPGQPGQIQITYSVIAQEQEAPQVQANLGANLADPLSLLSTLIGQMGSAGAHLTGQILGFVSMTAPACSLNGQPYDCGATTTTAP